MFDSGVLQEAPRATALEGFVVVVVDGELHRQSRRDFYHPVGGRSCVPPPRVGCARAYRVAVGLGR